MKKIQRPVVGDGEIPTQRQAHDRARQAATLDVWAAPCFSAGKLSQEDRLAGRLETSAAGALKHAEQDQLFEARGHAAQSRGDRKNCN